MEIAGIALLVTTLFVVSLLLRIRILSR